MKSNKMKVFIYQWVPHEVLDKNDNPEALVVHGYGLDENNNNVCLCVKNFHPWISIEVEELQKVTDTTRLVLQAKIEDFYKGPYYDKKLYAQSKYKLYFDQGNQKFPIYRMYFPTIKDRKTCFYKIKDAIEAVFFNILQKLFFIVNTNLFFNSTFNHYFRNNFLRPFST